MYFYFMKNPESKKTDLRFVHYLVNSLVLSPERIETYPIDDDENLEYDLIQANSTGLGYPFIVVLVKSKIILISCLTGDKIYKIDLQPELDKEKQTVKFIKVESTRKLEENSEELKDSKDQAKKDSQDAQLIRNINDLQQSQEIDDKKQLFITSVLIFNEKNMKILIV